MFTCCFPWGPPPAPAAVIRRALPATLPQTAATRPAPHPRLKTAAVTARTAPALPPRPPPRLPPAPTQTLIPRAVLTKALRRREKRRNEGPVERFKHRTRIIRVWEGWEVMNVKKQIYCHPVLYNVKSHTSSVTFTFFTLKQMQLFVFSSCQSVVVSQTYKLKYYNDLFIHTDILRLFLTYMSHSCFFSLILNCRNDAIKKRLFFLNILRCNKLISYRKKW